ncbi:hypothetical protein ACJJTC_004338 [Scirpophaga incertulas]
MSNEKIKHKTKAVVGQQLPSPPSPKFLPVTVNHSTTDCDLPAQLKHWATIQHQVSHNAVDSLLKILTPLCPSLPKDSRTLLKTPINIEVTTLDTGEMVYMGILSQIQKQLKLNIVPNNTEDRVIKISFNVDGLPLFKSSNTQLWPVLAFPFENYLGALKNLVRSPNKPLQQIVKRLLEMESSQFVGMSSNDEFVSYPYESGPVPHEDVVQTKCLVIPNENDSSFVCFPLLHAYGDK